MSRVFPNKKLRLLVIIFALMCGVQVTYAQTQDTLMRLEYAGLPGQCTLDEANSLGGGPDIHESDTCIGSGSRIFTRTHATYRVVDDTLEVYSRMLGSQQYWYDGRFKVTLIHITGDVVAELWIAVSEYWPAQRGGSSSGVVVKLRNVPITWAADSSMEIRFDSLGLSKYLVELSSGTDWSAGTGGWTKASSFTWNGKVTSDTWLRLYLPPRWNSAKLATLDRITEITLAPNPTKDYVLIFGGSPSEDIEIQDQLGRLVKVCTSSESKSVDVSTLPSGLYWLKAGSSKPARLVINR